MVRGVIEADLPDYYDVVSAIWILSCNDENPIITNSGVVDRLALPVGYDVSSMIRGRRELFRPGVTRSRLERWKTQLRAGRGLPAWLQEIADPNDREQRISAISADDVFRNQFRITEDAPRCDLTIINWGLEHIERLRKAALDARNERRQRWSTMIVPTGTLIVAALSLICSLYVQIQITHSQIAQKQYEVTLKPKQDGYSRYMASLYPAYSRAANKDRDGMSVALISMEETYFTLEPFLDRKVREILWETQQRFEKFCSATLDAGATLQSQASLDSSVKEFTELRRQLRDVLYQSLFTDKP
jgi:hypothetical protein